MNQPPILSSLRRKVLGSLRSQPFVHSVGLRTLATLSRHISNRNSRSALLNSSKLFELSPLEAHHLAELKEEGYTVIKGLFLESEIDRLNRLLEERLPKNDTPFNEPKNSYNYGRVLLKNPLLQLPESIPFAFHPTIIKILTHFEGFLPLNSLLVFKSLPLSQNTAPGFFHRDGEHTLTTFVYLTDVDENSGPFVYVPRSQGFDRRSCFPRTNYDLGIEGDNVAYSHEEIAKYYPPETWQVVRAPRGSVLIGDATGFHRGPSWDLGTPTQHRARNVLNLTTYGRSIHADHKNDCHKVTEKTLASLLPLQRLFIQDSLEVQPDDA